MNLKYTRILVKISGEQLGGADGVGFDKQVAKQIAGEVAQAVSCGAELAIMVGGGNFVRGAQVEGAGIQRVTGDFMGMLATLINALALGDVFTANSVPVRILTNLPIDQAADLYTQRRAINQLSKGRVLILGGGIGRPFLTTDTAAVALALELDCDLVCKITKVNGVYDKDPAIHSDAQALKSVTFKQAVEDDAIRVMDKSALALAKDYNKPIAVCSLAKSGNLKNLILGQKVGTIISLVPL